MQLWHALVKSAAICTALGQIPGLNSFVKHQIQYMSMQTLQRESLEKGVKLVGRFSRTSLLLKILVDSTW